jgi:hypothetical protein
MATKKEEAEEEEEGEEQQADDRGPTMGNYGTTDIDLSGAPSDIVQLGGWVANQIRNLQPAVSDGVTSSVPSHELVANAPPGALPNSGEGAGAAEAALDRERQKEENRERKKRWRVSNVERSTWGHSNALS